MALPAAIQAQVEQADALLAAMNAPQDGQTQVTEGGPAAEPQTAQASNAVPQAEPQAQAPAPQPSEETWERKFKSLQGIFNKEVPSLQGQVKELTARLNQAVEQMESRKTPEPEQVAHKPEADPKDVENFGSDLVEMVQRTAERLFGGVANKVDAELLKLASRIIEVEKRLEGTAQSVALTAEEKFFDAVAKQVPEWEEINQDPLFVEWLAEIDPIYGQPRQAALNHARQSLDAQRVVNVFKAFAGPAKPPVPNTPNPVDKQVAPKSGGSSNAPKASNVQVVSQKSITDFYNDVARGRYRGRESDQAATEAAINTAIAEGRVR
jgi:hypothetical protein